jgi:hypothetical protein
MACSLACCPGGVEHAGPAGRSLDRFDRGRVTAWGMPNGRRLSSQGAGGVRRAHAQDDRHVAGGRVAMGLRDRGGLRARRGGVRVHGQARDDVDLRRDPQFALHSVTVDPVEMSEAWPGEAKISGRAVPAGPIEGPDGGSFYVDIHLSDMQHSQLGPAAVDTRAHIQTVSSIARLARRTGCPAHYEWLSISPTERATTPRLSSSGRAPRHEALVAQPVPGGKVDFRDLAMRPCPPKFD